jgi:hypothetical protein
MNIGFIAYASLFLWLGWFPWQEALRIGEGHFEFPLALLGQWIIYAMVVLIEPAK